MTTARYPDAREFDAAVAACGLTEKVHDHHTLSGLLLAVASAPELIPPSEWLPLIYVDEQEELDAGDSIEDFNQLLEQLMSLWNHWATVLDEDRVLDLPQGCQLEGDQPSPALSRFCGGVMAGYGWLEESWGQILEVIRDTDMGRELEDVYGATLVAAMLLAEPDRTSQLLAEDNAPAPTLDEAMSILPAGLQMLGSFGKIAARENLQSESGQGWQQPVINSERHIGRNDPCPCGSGKKYKRCCLQ